MSASPAISLHLTATLSITGCELISFIHSPLRTAPQLDTRIVDNMASICDNRDNLNRFLFYIGGTKLKRSPNARQMRAAEHQVSMEHQVVVPNR